MFFTCLIVSLNGCVVLVAAPVVGLVGHKINKSNQEKDDIIVNLGIKYKNYYNDKVQENEKRSQSGLEEESVLDFYNWLETQGGNEKERKAIERYKRIHLNYP